MKKIIEFQKEHGLFPDGKIGKNTLNKLKEVLFISSDEHLAHFLGQCDHESGGFNADTENLNYSAKGLLSTFKKYFEDLEHALIYERKPEKIGSRVYANRMGNGNEMTKEGYIYRGRGAIQLTGRDNYKAFAKYMNNPAIEFDPTKVAKEYYFDSALFFFRKNNLFSLCNVVSEDAIRKLTRRVNGGHNGLADRIKLTNHYYTLLKR